MLNLKWIVENKDEMKRILNARGESEKSVDTLINADKKRRAFIQECENMRNDRHKISKKIGEAKKKGEEVEAVMEESRKIGNSIKLKEKELEKITSIIEDYLLRIPNILDKDVPIGKGEEDNVELYSKGIIPKFSYAPLDHHSLGEKLGIIDFERTGRISGSRFSSLVGKGAALNRAISQFMLETHTKEHGYKEILPPVIVNTKALMGTAQFPKFYEDVFHLGKTDYHLIPTSEVPLTNFHREEILAEKDLPFRYTAHTSCFREEAGSYGKDTRGLIRQHQFEKVELVIISPPSISWEMHEEMKGYAEKILELLELPYRLIQICSGDTGFSGAKQYDLEVWLPGQNKYREISSCSNCLDYQARRANMRFRPSGGGKPEFVHTLNASALAVGRTLLAILENYQQEDGSILIPKVLQKHTGFDRIDS